MAPPSGSARIVVGLDDAVGSHAALQWAARQARLTGLALHAVHVLDWPVGMRAFGRPAEAVEQLPESEVNSAYRAGMARIFAAADPEPGWRLTYAEGDAGEMLVRCAQGAELLVLGAVEHPGTGEVIGAATAYCLCHAPCPVVAVPAT